MGRVSGALAALAVSLAVAPAASAQGLADAPCAWPFKSDEDSANIAFPDRGATYWVTSFVTLPGQRLVIRGRYARARYFSFHAYDLQTRPVGGLADHEIDPDPGSRNRFRRARGRPPRADDRYTVRVEFTGAPELPAPNTLYAGESPDGAPNPVGVLIYRVYVSDDPSDPRGRRQLPDVALESLDGSRRLDFRQCTPLPPGTGGAVNDLIADSAYPEGAPRGIPYAQNPPRWNRFYGLVGTSGGFLSNQHIAYGTMAFSRQHGDVVVFRARAPSFPDTRAGTEVTRSRQVRYWSICQNELATQRFVECSADHETVLGRDGWFTFVISDPADRPRNATRARRVNWLPWGGPYYDGLVLYRHMLPRAPFAGAWQRVALGTAPEDAMGDFYPRSAYCTKERFEAGGWRACLGG